MRPTVKYLSSACAGALLFACADTGPRGAAPPVRPAQLAGSPDDAYLLGRQQHLANRHPLAIASYQAALRLDPRHVNATNGLATLYAEQGNFPKAIALWRELTDSNSAPSGPSAAFIYSNLGYAYLLNGDYQQAVATLERACVLDPFNYRAWRHLGSSLEKLGQAERAQLMFKQASTLEQHDFKADYTLVERSGAARAADGVASAGAVDAPVAAAAAATDRWAATEVRQGANGMLELRRIAPAAAPAAMPVPVAVVMPAPERGPVEQEQPEPEPVSASAAVAKAAAAADDEITRLEIRNGNGVTGMARSLARKMGDAGVRVVRLSNEKGFNVARTRIEYQSGFREAATRLAERFGDATVTEVASCNNADMRLVIGRDLVRSKAEARRIIKAALARAAKAS
jgi:tetratricopeptide (TPR) repeat protein